MIRCIALCLMLLTLGGCASTHTVPLHYRAPEGTTALPAASGVSVGSFADRRGTDARWVGAIRGGYGNVLKKLLTPDATAEVVRQAFQAALQARSVPVAVEGSGTGVRIEGEILKLDCSYFFNREAHAHLLVRVKSADGQRELYARTIQTDNSEGGVGAGIFGNVEHLAQFEEKTLNQTVDRFFADPAFVAALQAR